MRENGLDTGKQPAGDEPCLDRYRVVCSIGNVMRYRAAEQLRGTALLSLGFGATCHTSVESKPNQIDIDGRPESRHW